ncbi:hypothetical protein Pyrfu_0968 [Pyrolobus fumarii 1A]|uniref:Uncharacterized protein n=1 Tax=Pyrolobus fumarii (strain DSM 11204 / 1A) TaxID=694429 RepID=G0EEL5_PYRF1|nr:hypothetical protein [Pyrolobus fumarii]AEM38837.1 hypothetical protein Pyrfu_0968 [Pyrolobus fumarii 1A]
MIGANDFEVIEEYELMGEKRFRVRLKGTNIVFNVAANDAKDAVERAVELARKLEIDKVLEKIRNLFES